MEILKWHKDIEFNPNDLKRIGDISYYEGPLLVLYENIINNHLYFLDWVDHDESVNRWLIYKVMPRQVLNYVTKQTNLAKLVSEIDIRYLFAVDIRHGNSLAESKIYKIEEIPKVYLPDNDVLFEKSDCSQFELIKNVAIEAMGNAKRENSFDSATTLPRYTNESKGDAHFALNYPYLVKHCDTIYNSSSRLKRIVALKHRFEAYRSHFSEDDFITIISIAAHYQNDNSIREISEHRTDKVLK